ncbi:hypothetical protein AGR56_08970 [Clostridium sp. DMHC 10]|uniref:hypothetical protein n=1 Tax=Clostridium sp. DMHC 10 TaxID=747377 RepID=UPI00069FFB0A|nr:hypothetical protein [Clostridium sp. DMHC 10]KOF56789.1 hypothetical protein AGR56_08970 [Clostridium sp. DMHC 10]
MENDKIFELMTKMYAEMHEGFKDVKNELKSHGKRLDKIESKMDSMESRMTKIDIKLEELDKKVDLSLEGHKTNVEQLNRIEKEVSKHEDFILRRIK